MADAGGSDGGGPGGHLPRSDGAGAGAVGRGHGRGGGDGPRGGAELSGTAAQPRWSPASAQPPARRDLQRRDLACLAYSALVVNLPLSQVVQYLGSYRNIGRCDTCVTGLP